MSLRAMQELFAMADDDSHGFTLKLRNGANLGKSVLRLRHNFPELRVLGWQELNSDFLFVLKLEKAMMMFVLLFILLVASFSIAGSLMISVVKKRREIGLLCALGATKREVSMIFLLEGVSIGFLGSVFGLLFGCIAMTFRNGILAILTRLIGINDFLLRFYDFARLPAKYSVSGTITIVLFALLSCALAGLIPALAVAKINPSYALRNE
jgi:lipoprotein-releasing system permease protein